MSKPNNISAPVKPAERISNLDLARGVATLGILVMNMVSFGLAEPAYSNLSVQGSRTWLDWGVGMVGEILFDQKMMGIFSLLFGVGIVIFVERAQVKGHSPWKLSLWRNLLLLLIGVLHALIWEGDILIVYALCSVAVLSVRKWPGKHLLVLGTALVLLPVAWGWLVQQTLSVSGAELGSLWLVGGGEGSEAVELYRLGDYFARALGMMLIGVGLYQLEVVQGQRPAVFYRRMIRWGLGVGLPLSLIGVIWQSIADYSTAVAIVGQLPNTVGTIPVALGYLGLITLWNQRTSSQLWQSRLQAVGRMALTNYLTQTVIGITLLRVLEDRGSWSRIQLLGLVLSIWLLQLLWSGWWLRRFRFGPIEWVWRIATYRRYFPIAR